MNIDAMLREKVPALTWVFNPLNKSSIEHYERSLSFMLGSLSVITNAVNASLNANNASFESLPDMVSEAYGYPCSAFAGRVENGIYKSDDGDEDLFPIAVVRLKNDCLVWLFSYDIVAFSPLRVGAPNEVHEFVTRLT
ncbi:hypothetical protein [Aliivibrio finisterrensis]|uniref:Uncharacterized protein n=1 Tax=Aliivibrio finisterrensis TaxID=511998 RepID=A0ABY0IAQ1_9GAMM|nr:hypothetical protein [Aliivibrio finisterrensis]RYU64326.1 hypothetical protein ERW53_10335 [Aliivibrio finisterrensis]RYU83938.1 hypothetical protein ERW52_12175 [Aliivibrio finisterrensis]